MRRQDGYTLVELLATSTLVLGVILILTSIETTWVKAYRGAGQDLDVADRVDLAKSLIVSDIERTHNYGYKNELFSAVNVTISRCSYTSPPVEWTCRGIPIWYHMPESYYDTSHWDVLWEWTSSKELTRTVNGGQTTNFGHFETVEFRFDVQSGDLSNDRASGRITITLIAKSANGTTIRSTSAATQGGFYDRQDVKGMYPGDYLGLE